MPGVGSNGSQPKPGEIDLHPRVRVLLGDARDAVCIRSGGITFDIAGGQADHARHDRHRRGERRAVALPLIQQKPRDKIAVIRRHVLQKRIRIGASQIGAQGACAVKIGLRVLGDLPGQRIYGGIDASGQGEIVFADGFGVGVRRLRGGQNDFAKARRVAAQALAGKRIDVAESQAARAENLAGPGKNTAQFRRLKARKSVV